MTHCARFAFSSALFASSAALSLAAVACTGDDDGIPAPRHETIVDSGSADGGDATLTPPPATDSGGSVDGQADAKGEPEGGAGLDAATEAGTSPDAAPSTYLLGGTVVGLTGTGLVLQSADSHGVTQRVAPAGNGGFTFPSRLTDGAIFTVTVATEPTPQQACSVSGGTGTIGGHDVTSLVVNCTKDSYVVGGTVTGLDGSGLVLQNDGENLPVNAGSTTFAFTVPVGDGDNYNVSVGTQPAGPTQTCTVTGGSGTIAGGDVSNVAVACTTDKFSVGGMVTGLGAGNALVLEDEGVDDLPVSGDGKFTFGTKLASGSPYAVTVKSQSGPVSETCTVTGGADTVGGANVTSVQISCAPVNPTYYVNPASGSDASSGTAASPWRTVTHAIASAAAGAANIYLAAGTYNQASGEVFPLEPRSNQLLVGNPGDPAACTVTGNGNYTVTGGDYNAAVFAPAIAFGAGVSGAGLSGVTVAAGALVGVLADNATVTLSHVAASTSGGMTNTTLYLFLDSAHVTMTSCSGANTRIVAMADPGSSIHARNNTFTGGATGIFLGDVSPMNGALLDFGTAADPGGNTILGAGTGAYGMYLYAVNASAVSAAGNTWLPNTQGSTTGGTYPAMLVSGPQTGANYGINVSGGSIQF